MTTFRLKLAVVACIVLAAGSSVCAQSLTKAPIVADAYGGFDFTVPSNNIECGYTAAGGTPTYTPPRNEAELSCDRVAPTYLHFSIGAHGPAILVRDPGEQPCCSDVPVLNYGQTWKAPPFSCSAAETGLTCTRDDGHGFFISRAKAKTF